MKNSFNNNGISKKQQTKDKCIKKSSEYNWKRKGNQIQREIINARYNFWKQKKLIEKKVII